MSHSNNPDEEVQAFDKALIALILGVCIVVLLSLLVHVLGDEAWQSFGSFLWSLLSSGH
jgi:hypothetical protein